jgi:hypothetical protein
MENLVENQDEHYNLINRLVEINNQLEQLWIYHPLNPHKLDIVNTYSVLENELGRIKCEIEKGF